MRNRATTPLKSTKIRMSMSPYNLYNLSRLQLPSYKTKTFYQQKWGSKSLLRQYHGEYVREGQWERMFSRRLRSVVPMDPAYLAKNDGSAESAGRGRGLEVLDERGRGPRRGPGGAKKEVDTTPYMNMTFAPLERRLDVAIFRALFASSARQARQFVIHGRVKVNGQVMRFPGYLLNPGDMFQVEPETVLIAMGRRKRTLNEADQKEAQQILEIRRKAKLADKVMSPLKEKCQNCGKKGHVATSCPKPLVCKKCKEEGHVAADCDKESGPSARASPDPVKQAKKVARESKETKKVLKDLQSQAKRILTSPREGLGGKQKQSLREFQQTLRRMMSKAGQGTILTDSLEAQFEDLKHRLKVQRTAKEQGKSVGPSQQAGATGSEEAEQQKKPGPSEPATEAEAGINYISEQEENELYNALRQMRENPRDPSKPYHTPLLPRMYMSAFAFIPRYLEVNQNVCAAVYLRHPVARPGMAEVPTPYPESVNASAFAWYLRRR